MAWGTLLTIIWYDSYPFLNQSASPKLTECPQCGLHTVHILANVSKDRHSNGVDILFTIERYFDWGNNIIYNLYHNDYLVDASEDEGKDANLGKFSSKDRDYKTLKQF